jgi:ferric-dicitrate binding protein FerR (iron transport regulator)
MEKEEIHNEIYILLTKCLTGEASEEENRVATEWIHASNSNRKLYNSLRDAWIASALEKDVDASAINNIWEKVRNSNNNFKETSKTTSRTLKLILKYAAIALLFMSIGGILHYFASEKPANTSALSYTVEAPLGARAKVTLPDGSLVNLNAGSKLTYKSNYNLTDRVVNLEGEAFFHVAKEKTKPFKVVTSSMVVHALGTSFNVKAYPLDDKVETTLVEGSVKVESQTAKSREHILKPNEKITFSKTYKSVEISEVGAANKPIVEKRESKHPVAQTETIESITSWKDNKLIFENEPLAEMAAKMRRWYGIDIYLNSVDSLNARYSGKFIYNETVYQVLDILSRTTPIKYETRNHKIYIYNKNEN